jgi:hypothetical protein
MPSYPRGLWRDLPVKDQRQLRAKYRMLRRRYGPFNDVLTKDWARLTVETWWTATAASEAAMAETLKRRDGKGRRPPLQAIDRRLKRQGLGVGTFDSMLHRLEELAGRRNGQVQDLTNAALQLEALLRVPPRT